MIIESCGGEEKWRVFVNGAIFGSFYAGKRLRVRSKFLPKCSPSGGAFGSGEIFSESPKSSSESSIESFSGVVFLGLLGSG